MDLIPNETQTYNKVMIYTHGRNYCFPVILHYLDEGK